MADRQVNVNINYKVNTVEVERYTGITQRADQATEKLRQGTQQFATQSAAGFRFTSKAVEGMEIELARLRQQIKLTNTEDTKRLNDLTNKYRQAKAQLDSYNKSLFDSGKAARSAAGEAKQLATQFGQVYTAAKLFITAGIVREVVSIQLNMAKLSGNVEGVERAFSKLPNSILLLESLRTSTHGTVTDLELMQKALMAQNFRIPLQSLGTLLEFAAVKAQQTGQEVNHLIDYIVSGIGYRSIKRLDDLGFTANRLKEALGGVSIQAASMSQIMGAVTKLMNEDLSKTGGFAETAATKVGQLERKWHELGVTASNIATNPKILKFYEEVLDSFTRGLQVIFGDSDTVSKNLAKSQAIKEVQSFKEMHVSEEVLKNKQKALDVVQQEANTRLQLIGRNNDEIREIKERIQSFIEAEGEYLGLQRAEADGLNTQLKFYNFKNQVLNESIKILKQYMSTLGEVKPSEDMPGLIDAVKEKINELTEEIGSAKTLDAIRELNLQLEIFEARLKRLKSLGTSDDFRLFENIKSNSSEAGTSDDKISPLIKRQNAEILKGQIEEAMENIPEPVPVPVKPFVAPDIWDEVADEFAEKWREIASTGIFSMADIINASIQAEADEYDLRLNMLKNFYDEQIKLAGDNERRKTELAIERDREEQKLRKKAFEAEKEAKRLQTTINGAAGIANAFATLPFPAALVASVLIAAQTATQLAVINKQQYRGFAKGGVDIKGGQQGKDSIPAMIMPGESVITTERTKQSKQTLKLIHSGKFNDRVMRELIAGKSGGSVIFDDSKILKKLDEVRNATPDVELRAGMVYKGYKTGDTHKKWIRSNSMIR